MLTLRLAEYLYSRLSNRTFVRFALTGLSGVIVNLGTFQFMLYMNVHALIASPIAIELSIISNFLINNHWTFGHRTMKGTKRIRGLKFHLVSLTTLLVSYSTFITLRLLFPLVPAVILQGCAIVPAALFNFTVNSLWTFREEEVTVN